MVRRFAPGIPAAVLASMGLWATGLQAQDAKTVLLAAETAMGSKDLKSIQYIGYGFSANLGQSVNPASPWPKFDMPTYSRTINFGDSSSKEEWTRIQGNNPVRGGGAPIMGEQKQNAEVAGAYAWNVTGERKWLSIMLYFVGWLTKPLEK